MTEQFSVRLRQATEQDAAALCGIYAYYVENSAATFEYEVPSRSEFAARIGAVKQRFPYLAAEAEGQIVGYAYASPFHPRAAYAWSAESSIYLHPEYRGGGAGRQLYMALEKLLRMQGVLNLNACIAVTERDDDRLDPSSPLFHRRLGFVQVARFSECGYKFGRWYDMIWMEKLLGRHGSPPPKLLRADELKAEQWLSAGIQ